jgi:hypothetical protein
MRHGVSACIALGLCSCGRIAFDPIAGGGSDGGSGGGGDDGSAGETILVFREGLDGYSGTVDTYLDLANPDADHHLETTARWHDDVPVTQSQQHALLYFDLFLGSKVIPPGSTIRSAMLRIVIVQACVDPAGTVREIAIDWGTTTNWNTFGAMAGVQAADVRGPTLPAPTALGAHVLDVSAAVAAWTADPSRNNGWIISPAPMNGNGCSMATNDDGEPANRPELTVTLVAP